MQKNINHNKRVRVIAWMNLVFVLYYLFRFYRIHLGLQIYDSDGTPTSIQYIVLLILSISLAISGYFLLRSRIIGVTILKFAGIICIFIITLYFVWGLSFLWKPPYDLYPLSVIGNAFLLLLEYSIRFSYPAIAGFVILRFSDHLNLD